VVDRSLSPTLCLTYIAVVYRNRSRLRPEPDLIFSRQTGVIFCIAYSVQFGVQAGVGVQNLRMFRSRSILSESRSGVGVQIFILRTPLIYSSHEIAKFLSTPRFSGLYFLLTPKQFSALSCFTLFIAFLLLGGLSHKNV